MSCLVMQNDCRTRWNDYLVGADSIKSVLIDDSTVAHDGVTRFRNLHRALLLVTIKDYDDIVPLIAHLLEVL